VDFRGSTEKGLSKPEKKGNSKKKSKRQNPPITTKEGRRGSTRPIFDQTLTGALIRAVRSHGIRPAQGEEEASWNLAGPKKQEPDTGRQSAGKQKFRGLGREGRRGATEGQKNRPCQMPKFRKQTRVW